MIPAARLDDLRLTPAEPSRGGREAQVWDVYLMAYRDRRRFLPEAWYDFVYAGTGDATSTLLLDGAVGGVWDLREEKKMLVVKAALIEGARPGVWDKIWEQAVRLAEAAGYASASLVRCEPLPLKGGPRNRFRSPLKEASGETLFMM